MKRSGLILLTFILLSFFTKAQLRVAIVGGASSSSVKETNNLPGWDSIKNNYSSRTGFHLGFIADLSFSATSKFYFQPGVIFYTKGRKYAAPYDSIGTVTTFNSSQFVNYIDLPMNLVFKYPLSKKVKLMIGGGPYVSFFYNGKEKSETLFSNGDYKAEEINDLPVGKKPGQYKTFNYGVNALAGFEFGRVFLTANFSRGLGDFYTASYDGQFRHQVIGGTLGIFLGKAVEVEPRIKDKDKDGITDDKDACPNDAGTAATNGCPDKDADGIADKDDRCPDVAGIMKYYGCPIPDTDKDGINDEEDKCPTIAGIKKYNGCPVPDTDKDGINDEEDKCPTEAGLARYGGCPVPDSDGDGVNDEEDKCPNIAGTKENNGCPEIKKEIVEKINFAARLIQFEKAKADLLPASNKVLDDVVLLLRQNPELKLSIEGHTSDDGNYDFNMKLSKERAMKVEQYLIQKGIDPSRLQAEGFGPNKPLNNSKTSAGRALNRRVELKLSNQ